MRRHTRRLTNVLACVALVAGLHCRSQSDESRIGDNAASSPPVRMVDHFELDSATGNPFGSDELRGKVWIAMPMATGSLDAAEQVTVLSTLIRELDQYPVWDDVRLVTLSVDPEHDSPEALRRFAGHANVDSTKWTLLTGDRDRVATVIRDLGLPVAIGEEFPNTPISHSRELVLVDREHKVRGAYSISDNQALAAVVNDLLFVLPEAPDLDDGTGRTHLVIPPENQNVSWMDSRRAAQLAAAAMTSVRNDFSFTDRLQESGIRFRNKVVDNAAKEWIPNHYDHGNGVAIADVDGDGLIDLYFTSQVGGNELWRNLGAGRFEDFTDVAGVRLADRVNVTASFADIDNDGDPDLYVTSVRGGNVLFENDGTGTFKDITEAAGVDYRGHSSAAIFFDYNRDGLLDLFLVNVGKYTSDTLRTVMNGTSPEQRDETFTFFEGYDDAFNSHLIEARSESSILYKNLGNRQFVDVTDEVGLTNSAWSGDATPIDFNGDGWPDLYVLNMQGNDILYENIRGERFEERTNGPFPQTPWGAMNAKVFDYDNDGDFDLYVTDMHSDMSKLIGPEDEKVKADMQWPDHVLATEGASIFGNAFFERDGSSFREVSDDIGAENYWPWGLSVGDLNADGYLDVFIASSMNYPFRYGVNSLLLNDRGEAFVDSEFVLGVEPRRDGRFVTPWYELWCDGADRTHEYCDGRSGDVLMWGALGSRSSAIVDLDDDGDLDIVTNDFNSEPMVLISDLSERYPELSYLKVKLVGTTSNRDGLGARVRVRVNGRELVQIHDGVTGYLSHGVHPLYFGLDGASSVDEVEVLWPTGETQIVAGPIAPNDLLIVTEE